MRVLIFFFLLPSCYCQGFWQGFLDYPGAGWLQSTGVRGFLRCNGKLFYKVKLWLYDRENIKDALMSGPKEPDRRSFVYSIEGTTREISSIEPYLYIEHWCNRKKGQAPIHFCMDIPSRYVNRGRRLMEYWRLDMELSGKQKGQRSC